VKKTLFLLATVAILISSCKKDNSTTKPSAKKYNVTFNVTNFSTKQSAFALKRHTGPSSADALPSLNSYFDVLYYLVYDQNANLVSRQQQDSTMSNMGTITDALPAGNYHVSIIAGKNGLFIEDPNYYGGDDYGYGGNPWQDTFFSSFFITVGSDNISQGVTLTREVGKLEVKLLDNIPANAAYLTISTSQEAYGLDIWQGFYFYGPVGSVSFPVAIPDSAKGKPNFTIDRLIANTNPINGLPINIVCTAADNSVIASITVQNVYCYANQKTIVSGDLFSSIAGPTQSFTAVVDTAWSSGVTQVGFSLKHH